jgi:hypothetical protein
MFPQTKFQIRKLKDGRLAYAPSPLVRILAGLGALGLALVAAYVPDTVFPNAVWWMLAFLLFLAALSRESWSFGPGGVSREFGFFPFARHWELSAGRIASLGLAEGAEGEAPADLSDDRSRTMASLFGMGRGAWCALVARLSDGRSLTLVSGKPKEAARLRADGEKLAAALGLPFDAAGKPESGASPAD